MTKVSSHLSLVEALEREAGAGCEGVEQAAELVESFVCEAAGDHLDRLLAAAGEAEAARALATARQTAHTARSHATVVNREVARFLATSQKLSRA